MRLLKLLLSVTVGYASGLLFAKKSGKQLRDELKQSKTPAKDLFLAMKDADMEAWDEIKEWAKNNEEIQNLFSLGKEKFNDLVEAACELSEEGKEIAIEKMENIAEEATAAAKKIKKNAGKKLSNLENAGMKKAKKFKNELEKKAENFAKKIKK